MARYGRYDRYGPNDPDERAFERAARQQIHRRPVGLQDASFARPGYQGRLNAQFEQQRASQAMILEQPITQLSPDLLTQQLESPAVQQWREAQRIQEEQRRMAGQLRGGAYAVGTITPSGTGPYGAETYQDQQIASLAAPGGALTPARTGTPEGKTPNLSPVSPSLADTSFFPDQEIYTNPGAVDAGTLGAYQNRVNNFKRDFLQKAAMRKSNFSSVEEFKAFVENNPNYSPEIGTAAWDFAQSQLQRANPGLFQRITGQDKTREANNMSKLQWMEQALPNVAPDMTSEQKLRYINANPDLLQGWQQDATAAKYRMNPATNQLEQIPPSPEQAYEIERRKTGQYFTEEEKADMAGQGIPIIQTPKGLLAPGDKGYDKFVQKVPIKQENPTTGEEETVGYEYMPFKGVKTYQPATVTMTFPDGKQKQVPITDQERAMSMGGKVNQVAPSVVSPVTTPVVTPTTGRGTITGAGGQVLASRGVPKPKATTPATPIGQPKIISTPPVAKTTVGQPEEQRRQELLASAPSFDDSDVFKFVGEKAKSAGMTISDWANYAIQGLYGLASLTGKGAELVGKGVVGIPRTAIKTAEHLRTYIPTRLRAAIEDEMREKWVEEQLAKTNKAGE